MSITSADQEEKVRGLSTGIDKLDAMLGCGGLPIGRITTITGPFSSGKSSLALSMLSEAQKQGCKCLLLDAERAFSKEHAAALGVDLKKLHLARAAYAEALLDEAEQFILKHKKCFVVLDSYSALSPKAEMEADNERAGMMEKSRMVARFLRKMQNVIPETESVLVVIAHDYGMVLPGGRTKIVIAGGDQMEKAPSIWLKLYTQPIKEGAKRIGSTITLRQKKNKVGGTQDDECEIEYRFETGFVKELPALEKGLANGSITRVGNTYFRGEEKLGTISVARSLLTKEV